MSDHFDRSWSWRFQDLPKALEAEQAIIGSVLLHNNAYHRLSGSVALSDFHEPLHAEMWRQITALIENGHRADPIILRANMPDPDAEVGRGISLTAYLAHLVANYAFPANVGEYAKLLRRQTVLRSIISFSTRALESCRRSDANTDPNAILADLDRGIEEARRYVADRVVGLTPIGEVSMREMWKRQEPGAEEDAVLGLPTGLQRLDEATGGLRDGALIVIGGRPGMGKTALIGNICVSAGRYLLRKQEAARAGGQEERRGVLAFFSLEMEKPELKMRMMTDMASVSQWRIERRRATLEELNRVAEAEQELGRLPLVVDDSHSLSLQEIRRRARELKRTSGVRMILVDYIQLISLEGGERMDMRQTIARITQALKQLAKELKVPVVALSQLKRLPYSSDHDYRPKPSDLAESGSIEADADLVLLLHREEVYLKLRKPRDVTTQAYKAWDRQMARWKGTAEVILGKQRGGIDTTLELGWCGDFYRFENDPPLRDEPAEEAQQQQKKREIRLSRDANALYGTLRSLITSRGRHTMAEDRDIDPRLLKNAMLITRADAKRQFVADQGADDFNQIKGRYFRAHGDLVTAGLVQMTGTDDRGWSLWLPRLTPKE